MNTRMILLSVIYEAGQKSQIKAGGDEAAAPGPPLHQVNEVIKVTDMITFKK